MYTYLYIHTYTHTHLHTYTHTHIHSYTKKHVHTKNKHKFTQRVHQIIGVGKKSTIHGLKPERGVGTFRWSHNRRKLFLFFENISSWETPPWVVSLLFGFQEPSGRDPLMKNNPIFFVGVLFLNPKFFSFFKKLGLFFLGGSLPLGKRGGWFLTIKVASSRHYPVSTKMFFPTSEYG